MKIVIDSKKVKMYEYKNPEVKRLRLLTPRTKSSVFTNGFLESEVSKAEGYRKKRHKDGEKRGDLRKEKLNTTALVVEVKVSFLNHNSRGLYFWWNQIRSRDLWDLLILQGILEDEIITFKFTREEAEKLFCQNGHVGTEDLKQAEIYLDEIGKYSKYLLSKEPLEIIFS